jgi:undecaprenyl-diphosphatase
LDLLQAIVLALLQGITEFLPVSSSAHLILPAALTDWPDQGLAFDVAVHLGSLVAVVIYFRAELARFVAGGVRFATGSGYSEDVDLMLKIGVATLPTVVAGLLLKDLVEGELRSVAVIATTTIVFGLLLGLADRRHGSIVTLSWAHALLIGASQVLALIPGTSRSGITMTAALLLGLSRTTAARASFLLSIPTIAGAALLLGVDVGGEGLAGTSLAALGTGFVVAGVSAYLCIDAFIRLVERTGMLPYVLYRLLLGSVLFALIGFGLVPA